jgi:hypothetical protein
MMRKKQKKPPVSNKGGRPRAEIDYKLLDSLCHINCTGEECASVLGIDYDTLNRCLKRDKKGGFTEYYKKKSAAGRASLRRKQWQKALGTEGITGKDSGKGDTTMLIWLGKQHLGQSDKPLEEEKESKPLNINVTVLPKASEEIPPEYLSD